MKFSLFLTYTQLSFSFFVWLTYLNNAQFLWVPHGLALIIIVLLFTSNVNNRSHRNKSSNINSILITVSKLYAGIFYITTSGYGIYLIADLIPFNDKSIMFTPGLALFLLFAGNTINMLVDQKEK